MNTPLNGNALQVLVVDDSAMVRQVMQAILEHRPQDQREGCGGPTDCLGQDAERISRRCHHGSGNAEDGRADFHPENHVGNANAVVVCSGLAARGTELAFRALEEGAVEVITKPKVGVRDFLHESAVTLLDAVWSASQAQMKLRAADPLLVPLLMSSLLHKHKSCSRLCRRTHSLPSVLRRVERKLCACFWLLCQSIARRS